MKDPVYRRATIALVFAVLGLLLEGYQGICLVRLEHRLRALENPPKEARVSYTATTTAGFEWTPPPDTPSLKCMYNGPATAGSTTWTLPAGFQGQTLISRTPEGYSVRSWK